MNRIERAINIFLDAINNGTLAKGTCIACAVGNLVAHGMKGIIYKTNKYSFECNVSNSAWGYAFITTDIGQIIDLEYFTDPLVLECVNATEFTVDELMKIEHAFEGSTEILCINYPNHTPDEIRKDQINGLTAVIKVMETFDNHEPNKYIEQFIKEASLIPV